MGSRGDVTGSHRRMVAQKHLSCQGVPGVQCGRTPSRIRRISMAERPDDRQWTRRGFMSTVARAGAGLAGGAVLAGRPGTGAAQGTLKTFTASHSVSTIVYGQHLV